MKRLMNKAVGRAKTGIVSRRHVLNGVELPGGRAKPKRKAARGFKPNARIDFYEEMAALVGAGKPVRVALETIYGVYSRRGRRPKDPVAKVVKVILDSPNQALSVTLAPWISGVEAAVLAGGEATGGDALLRSFERCVAALQRRASLMSAVLTPLRNTIMLGLLWLLITYMIAFQWAPEVLDMIPIDQLPPATLPIVHYALFVNAWWWLMAGSIVAVVWLVRWSVPNTVRSSKWGRRVGKVPPYNLYGMYQSTQWLDNLVALIGSGRSVAQALETSGEHGDRWLHERTSSTVRWFKGGKSLGESLDGTGYSFPDEKTILFIKAIESNDAFEEALESFGGRWFKITLKRIERLSFIANTIGMALLPPIWRGGWCRSWA